MIREVYICDNCHKEVDWLYCFCPPVINGRTIDFDSRDESIIQLCKHCTKDLIKITNGFKKPTEVRE